MNQLKKVNAIKSTDTSHLIEKADPDTKIGRTEKRILDHDHINKYITTQKYDRLTAENIIGRLEQAKLATKADIDNFIEKTDFDDKLTKK